MKLMEKTFAAMLAVFMFAGCISKDPQPADDTESPAPVHYSDPEAFAGFDRFTTVDGTMEFTIGECSFADFGDIPVARTIQYGGAGQSSKTNPETLTPIALGEIATENTAETGGSISFRIYNPYDEKPYLHHDKPIQFFYFTGRNYQLGDTDLQKLLMWRIAKVQVELAGGEIKEFKIKKRQGKKMLKKLQDSWRTIH